jgi:hypothetical protein
MIRFCLTLLAVSACMMMPASAQTAGQAYNVELSVPFGTIPGKLLVLNDFIVFVDEQQPGSSFVLPRNQITGITGGTMALVEMKAPVDDRSGPRTRFSFRFVDENESAAVTRWFRSPGNVAPVAAAVAPPAAAPVTAPVAPAGTPAAPAASGQQDTYQVRHEHLLGGCHGRLAISEDRVIYESTDNISHSRNWQLKDIKELKQNNPYKLTVEPFRGDKYTLNLEGQGMDPKVFKALVDRVTAARSVR